MGDENPTLAELQSGIQANAKVLGLAGLPVNTQARIAVWMHFFQHEHGLDADAAYDMATERATNSVLDAAGYDRSHGGSSLVVPPGPAAVTNLVVVQRWLAQVEYAALHHDDGKAMYGLSHGSDWTAPNVFAKDGQADCSAAILYGLCVKKAGRWNTDAMVNDAYLRENGRFVLDANGRRVRGRELLFRGVDDHDVRVGDVFVYPGPDRDHDGHREGAGHCMGAVDVPSGFVMYEDGWEAEASGLRLAHCRWKKYAMRVTSGGYADKPGIVVLRCKAVQYV